MPKPEWLIDNERKKQGLTHEPDLCKDCIYFGKYHHTNKFRRSGRKVEIDIYECDLHPGCFNSETSICCGDWTGREV